jgi:hypothetical protein
LERDQPADHEPGARESQARLRDRHRRELFVSLSSAGIDVMGDRLETTGMRSDAMEFPAEFTVTNIAIAGQSRFTV